MNSALRKICQIPCPVPLVPHWLKPVAWAEKNRERFAPRTQHSALSLCTHARLHTCTLTRIWNTVAKGSKLPELFFCCVADGTSVRRFAFNCVATNFANVNVANLGVFARFNCFLSLAEHFCVNLLRFQSPLALRSATLSFCNFIGFL
jgi:hypothetical protein